MKRDKLVSFLDKTLRYEEEKDPYGPNSLQVIGKDEVGKVAFGVSANLELFKKAAEWGADMIVVHHGLFWNKDERVIKKIMKVRLKILFNYDISLVGYHLFLDNHPTLGNNAQIIKLLGAKKGREFGSLEKINWGFEAKFKPKITIEELSRRVEKITQKTPKIFPYGLKFIGRIAVVSGGGPRLIKEAIDKNLDAYLTGEPAEPIEAFAKEGKINFIYFGHYNSEKFGILALADFLKKKFPQLELKFIDVPNPL